MKRALWAAAATAAALVMAVAGSAATLPGGTSISAAITSPSDGAVVSSTAPVPISASGSVGTGQAVANTTLVYIVDVSGSTVNTTGGTNCPNQNVYDNLSNTTIDCELLAIRNLNAKAIQLGTVASIGMIGFGGNTFDEASTNITDAFNVDLSTASGVQTLVAPDLLDFTPGTTFALNNPATNLDWAVNGFWVSGASIVLHPGWASPPGGSGFSLFTQRAFNANTNYAAALLTLKNMLPSITTPHISVVMVSDGDSTIGISGNTVGNILNTIAAPGKTISFSTFAIGATASCGSATTTDPYGTLAQISAHFGQTCQLLPDPQQAITAVPAIISSKLTGLNVSVDGSNIPRTIDPPLTLPANGPATVTASASSPILSVGDHSFCANAAGTDGGGTGASGNSCITVHAKAPPVITLAGGDGANGYAATRDEGSSFDVGASVANGYTSAQWTASGGTGTCTFADPTALNTSVTCDNGDAIYALTLTVEDNATPAQTATATEHLKVDNVAPTIAYSVTPDTVGLNNAQVHAHVDITDPGAETWTCTFDWADTSTPTVVTTTARSCDADHTFTAAGVFPTHVGVTDDGLVPAEGVHGVTVQGPAQLTLPTGSAGGPAGTVPEGSPFAIHGSSDEPVSVAWSASGGDGTCSFGPAALDTSVTCTDEGLYHITVVATDSYGQTSSGGFDLQVTDVAPTAALTLSQALVPLGQSVHADVAITDPGADQWSCTIDWGDGSTSTTSPSTSKSCGADHAYTTGGPYTVKATVDDQDGNTGSDSQGLTVKGLPTFSGLPSDGANGYAFDKNEGQPFTINGSVGGATTLQWADASGHCSFVPANALPTTVTCDDGPGLYTLVLTATDQFGQSAEATVHAKIENVAPALTINAPTPGSSGRVVLFKATVTDPGVLDAPTCTIDWGDGVVETNVAVIGGFCSGQHTYGGTVQSATIAAFATDKDGAPSPTRTVSLTFNQPPVCVNVHADVATLWPADHRLVLVTLSGATDPDTGDTLTYAITKVTQDEPLLGLGSGDTSPDAKAASGGSVWLRAERDGTGDGRVYTITYTVTDSSGAPCAGGPLTVKVRVPHDQSHAAVDSGRSYNSFG